MTHFQTFIQSTLLFYSILPPNSPVSNWAYAEQIRKRVQIPPFFEMNDPSFQEPQSGNWSYHSAEISVQCHSNKLDNDVWIIEEHLSDEFLRGVAYMEIRKSNGEITKVIHTK